MPFSRRSREAEVTTSSDGRQSIVREYPNALAMSLLKMHRDTVREADASEIDEREVAEARERIASKLDRIAQRVAARKDDAGGDA